MLTLLSAGLALLTVLLTLLLTLTLATGLSCRRSGR